MYGERTNGRENNSNISEINPDPSDSFGMNPKMKKDPKAEEEGQ